MMLYRKTCRAWMSNPLRGRGWRQGGRRQEDERLSTAAGREWEGQAELTVPWKCQRSQRVCWGNCSPFLSLAHVSPGSGPTPQPMGPRRNLRSSPGEFSLLEKMYERRNKLMHLYSPVWACMWHLEKLPSIFFLQGDTRAKDGGICIVNSICSPEP